MVKRRAIRARQVWIREMSESYPSDEASKLTLDDTKTGVFTLFWEWHGRYLLTGHAVSGVEKARPLSGLSYGSVPRTSHEDAVLEMVVGPP